MTGSYNRVLGVSMCGVIRQKLGCTVSDVRTLDDLKVRRGARARRRMLPSLFAHVVSISCLVLLAECKLSGAAPAGSVPHTPLSKIDSLLLTTAGEDFDGRPDAYAASANWHHERLRRSNAGSKIDFGTKTTRGVAGDDESMLLGGNSQAKDGSSKYDRYELSQAPYLACSNYQHGKQALLHMRNYLGAQSVRTAAHSTTHGTCFLVSATLSEADAIMADLGSFGLETFGPFPSVVKISPGLLNHGQSSSTIPHDEGGRFDSEGQHGPHQDQLKGQEKQRLSTTHGFSFEDANVEGLNIELTPGIIHGLTHLGSQTGETGDKDGVREFLGQLRKGLMSKSLDMHGASFWSDKEMLEGSDGHLASSTSALRAQQWTRAADLVHSRVSQREAVEVEGQDKTGQTSPAEVCGWERLLFIHTSDDLLLVTGMQHLLPSAQSEEPDGNGDSEDDAQELKMACFMGLISYLADRSEVLRVSPFHAPRPLNAVARAIVQSAGIELTPLSDAGLDGTGEVVQVVDSGLDETSCFFIDGDGEEIQHGYYFDEVAMDSENVFVISTGSDFYFDMTRRKIVQYVNLIKSDVDGSIQPYGSGFETESGQLVEWYSASGFDKDDYDGHGTHTAGTVAGATLTSSATSASCDDSDEEYGCAGSCLSSTEVTFMQLEGIFNIDGYCPRLGCLGGDEDLGECLSDDTAEVLTQHGGVARGAKLAIFDVSGDASILPHLPGNDLWRASDDTGARIHSNSWGSSMRCLVSPTASLYDDFMYENPDQLLIYAAGNDGDIWEGELGTCSVGSPAISKNGLAVGASSSGPTRQTLTTSDGDTYTSAMSAEAADIDTMAYFSARGPTLDGRIKPDVVAPGDQVFSAGGDGTDNYSCRLSAQSGTSMACPVVAGSAAIVRQYFRNDTFYATDVSQRGVCDDPDASSFICEAFTPSAATLKAMLINSANLMGGSSEPDGDRGFGRVHLEEGMPLDGAGTMTLFVADSGTESLAEFAQDEYVFEVSYADSNSTTTSTSPVELRATLAWIDPASPAMASKQLQHDLDLSVKSPSGDTYIMWATSGLKDAANNVERVIVPTTVSSEEGEWTVIVSSQGLTTDTQTYSLVVTGSFKESSVSRGGTNEQVGSSGASPEAVSGSAALTMIFSVVLAWAGSEILL